MARLHLSAMEIMVYYTTKSFTFTCGLDCIAFIGTFWVLRFVWFLHRICVVTLAESHPILQNGRQIKSINYQISNGCSRLNNKVSGKSKRVNTLQMMRLELTVILFLQKCERLRVKLLISISLLYLQGGQFLTDFAPLCRITCTDENEYTIYRWVHSSNGHLFQCLQTYLVQSHYWKICLFSCIRGRLLEVNEAILETPSLLLQKVKASTQQSFCPGIHK